MGTGNGNSQDHDPALIQSKLLGPKCAGEENYRELFPEIAGRSPTLTHALRLVAKVARSPSSVLILGESGTGKELIASAIHRLSERRYKCFVAINCSAIPEELLEAELFGHEKGAFTGADRKRIGHFGAAEGGTIFLDEIGDMTPRLQSKLLRVLQEKQYSSVGSHTVKHVDVRIIAATNKDLEQAVKDNSFRLDLYYRLNVLPVELPPLRARAGDVELLLEHFCEQMNRLHLPETSCWFDPQALETLRSYSWPGNVRQLQNLVERLVLTHPGGRIGKDDLPPEFVQAKDLEPRPADEMPALAPPSSEIYRAGASAQLPKMGLNLNEYIESLENNLILQALQRTNNNKNQASKLLGMNRTTLVEKIKKRNISP
ncbi:MAG: sigma-54-dependent Fis family transcriptional regulator [Deltaproteobacteria bacterium]|nr:sigma-54-dependent Fis family transcriptional regulator [Deltaproteobacteria bacterium]